MSTNEHEREVSTPWPALEALKAEATERAEGRVWSTGSRRDRVDGKGAYYLIPYEPLRRLAVRYENGAKPNAYGPRNWEKGQPLCASYLDSCERHLQQLKAGLTDDDHAAAVAWNIFGFIQTLAWIEDGTLPAELDDRPAWARSQASPDADLWDWS